MRAWLQSKVGIAGSLLLALAGSTAARAAEAIQPREPGLHHSRPGGGQPVVHDMRDIYQHDLKFSRLFGAGRTNEICAPVVLTNLMLWLKDGRKPGFKNLFQRVCRLEPDKAVSHCSQRQSKGEDEYAGVFQLFKLCHTDKERGTSVLQAKHCVSKIFRESGYAEGTIYRQGLGGEPDRRQPVTPLDLVQQVKEKRGAMLNFGWYHRKTWQYIGGHFVALVGYDKDVARNGVVYISNPDIDYSQAEPGTKGAFYSKIVLEKVPESAPVDADHLPMHGLWQTSSMNDADSPVVGVLEVMLSFLPGEDLAPKQKVARAK